MKATWASTPGCSKAPLPSVHAGPASRIRRSSSRPGRLETRRPTQQDAVERDAWAAIVSWSASMARARPASSSPWSIQPMRPSANRWASSASLPNHRPALIASSLMSVNPASVSRPAPGRGRRGRTGRHRVVAAAGHGRRRAPRRSRGATRSPQGCQVTSSRRPPGRRALPMLRNAATWSPKNIAGGAADGRVDGAGSKAWTWASAWANVALARPSSAARAPRVIQHARGQVDSERRAALAARAASRVV